MKEFKSMHKDKPISSWDFSFQPAEESRRQNTFEYFVRISGKHLRVCKRAFMSCHGLTSDKRLRTLFHQMKVGFFSPLNKPYEHLSEQLLGVGG